MPKRSIPHIIFSLFYRSAYSIFLLLVVGLLLVTPADHVYQTVYNRRSGNAIVVACVIAVTAILAIFIYASRLYTNRTTLAAIPKPYLPIEPGEVARKVRKEIVKNRQRSALIAWETRPRDLTHEIFEHNRELEVRRQHPESIPLLPGSSPTTTPRHPHKLHKSPTPPSIPTSIVSFDPASPPWGTVSHPGWSSKFATSTASPDNPSAATVFQGINFETVVSELPHLIEAKAVSLAPTDPAFAFMQSNPSLLPSSNRLASITGNDALAIPPSPRVAALLQRPRATGLRGYLARLEDLGLVDPDIGDAFLARYETARFSTDALLETEFDELMALFAQLLENMAAVDLRMLGDALLERLAEDDDGKEEVDERGYESESEDDDDDGLEEDTGSVRRHYPAGADDAASLASSGGLSLASASSVVRHPRLDSAAEPP